MAGPRRYRLLCPIARALDRLGDRWALLILRDLHAGPARFSDLQAGLSGVAANLLTDRLNQLAADGLIERRAGAFGAQLYALTPLGGRTKDLLFELALFGARFPPDADLRQPGNLRTVAVTMSAAAERAARPEMALRAEIVIDDEPFALTLEGGRAEMLAGRATAPEVVMTTAYEPLIAASEGEMALEIFLRDHVAIDVRAAEKADDFMALMQGIMAQFADGAAAS